MLKEIDERWRWDRNVIDEYKNLSTEEIQTEIAKKSFPFAIMMVQIVGDFNFSSVVRSANFLGAKEVFYFGKRKWDRRGACGTYHYTNVKHLSSFEEVFSLKEKYSLVALENNINKKPTNIKDFVWEHKNSLIMIGEEGCGLSEEILSICDSFVEIGGFGSVRSLNAAVAASIAMYDYVSKFSE